MLNEIDGEVLGFGYEKKKLFYFKNIVKSNTFF